MSDVGQAPEPAARRRLPSPLKRIWRLCVKELRETLRDRRTMVTLILMPLIVYPLLSIIFQRFLIETYQATRTTKCIVGVERDLDGKLFGSLVLTARQYYEQQDSDTPPPTGKTQPPAGKTPPPTGKTQPPTGKTQPPAGRTQPPASRTEPSPGFPVPRGQSDDWLSHEIDLVVVADMRAAVDADMIDVGLRLAPINRAGEVPDWIEVIHKPTSYNSRTSRETVEHYFEFAREAYLLEQLREVTGRETLPMELRYEAIAGQSQSTLSLATLIPLILVLMTVTGAVYPAIDLTAGERERGTMEALIAAPVPRMGLLFAKYVAVVVVAILTATANLVAMTLTLWSSGVGKAIFGTGSLSLGSILAVFGMMVLFAAFFSSILLTVTSFARSFKEAQAYLIPLILLSLGPSLVCLAPGIELNGLLAVTPLINIVLLARNALEGQPVTALAMLCVVSTVLYAAAALAIAAKVFGSDAILYGSPTGWRDVFQRPSKPRRVPTLASALGCLALLFPLYVILVGALGQLRESPLIYRLGFTAIVTILLFGVLPYTICRLSHVMPGSGFRLHRAAVLSFIGCVVLGLSIWPMLQQLVLYQGPQDESQFELVDTFRNEARAIGPWMVLITMAIVPAIFEELFFRGFLFSSLRARLSGRQTVLITAFLFGAFHVLAKYALATERFLPTATMGLILGWVCLTTGSVLPGMLLHAVHNGLLLLMFYYRDELAARGFGAIQSDVVPTSWLVASAVGMAIGAVLVLLQSDREPRGTPEDAAPS